MSSNFENRDLELLKMLIGLLSQKVKFNDLNAKDVNVVYHCFEWLNSLENKMKSSARIEQELEELKEYSESLEAELKAVEEEEEVVEEKPKRRRRKKGE